MKNSNEVKIRKRKVLRTEDKKKLKITEEREPFKTMEPKKIKKKINEALRLLISIFFFFLFFRFVFYDFLKTDFCLFL